MFAGHCFSESTQPVFLVSQRSLGNITKKTLNLNFETAFISYFTRGIKYRHLKLGNLSPCTPTVVINQ